MTMATVYIEVERPLNWRGEKEDPGYDGDLDRFEIEVEGSVNVWVDPNYGADADGNRGMRMSGADVEDLEFTLYGDFRPFYVKMRDYILLAIKNFRRAQPLKWTQLSTYGYVKPDEKAFSAHEIEDAEERLIREAEDQCEPDPDDYYDRVREARAMGGDW